MSAHTQRQRQQTTTRGLSPSGRTLLEDGLEEDVVGHKAAAGRANAARSSPGSCQLIAVPRLQLLPHEAHTDKEQELLSQNHIKDDAERREENHRGRKGTGSRSSEEKAACTTVAAVEGKRPPQLQSAVMR